MKMISNVIQITMNLSMDMNIQTTNSNSTGPLQHEYKQHVLYAYTYIHNYAKQLYAIIHRHLIISACLNTLIYANKIIINTNRINNNQITNLNTIITLNRILNMHTNIIISTNIQIHTYIYIYMFFSGF